MNRSCFILLISAATAAHAAPPAVVEISYDIARNGTPVAEVGQRLDHDGKTYALTEIWKGKGILSLRGSAKRTSRGRVTPHGLRPLEYTDERSGRDTARATFDWTAQTLTQQYRDAPQKMALPPRPHDRLAFLFEFAFVPPRKPEVVFDVADGRGLSHQVYKVGEREQTRVPAGDFRTVKVTRTKEGERADLWLAVDRDYLPVRIVITQKDGVVLEQVATRIAP
jgi:hypothetical protein